MMLKYLEQQFINTYKFLKNFHQKKYINYLTNISPMLLELVMPELFRKLPSEIKKNKLKTGIFLVLSAYWGIIIVSTLIQFN